MILPTPLNLKDQLPDAFTHGAETIAPAAGAVLADTGVLPPGINSLYFVKADIAADDEATGFEVAVRDAANDADVGLSYVSPIAGSGSFSFYFNALPSQRIVVRNKNAGTSAKIYQASISAWGV